MSPRSRSQLLPSRLVLTVASEDVYVRLIASCDEVTSDRIYEADQYKVRQPGSDIEKVKAVSQSSGNRQTTCYVFQCVSGLTRSALGLVIRPPGSWTWQLGDLATTEACGYLLSLADVPGLLLSGLIRNRKRCEVVHEDSLGLSLTEILERICTPSRATCFTRETSSRGS